jgi:hypothetical protein
LHCPKGTTRIYLSAVIIKSEARNSKSETSSNARIPKFKRGEAPAKILQARGSRHSGQAKRNPESSPAKGGIQGFWILAFAGTAE